MHLFGKYLGIIVVVRNRGQRRTVGRQSNSRQWRPFDQKAIGKFRGDMLRVGGATTVAEEQELVAAFERRDDGLNSLGQRFKIVAQKSLLDTDAFVERFDDRFLHAIVS